jgi:alpha-tubulin suppressor-like RCC1 family protein
MRSSSVGVAALLTIGLGVLANAGSRVPAETGSRGHAQRLALPGTQFPFDHACAVMDDGTVRCWGANYGGVLGDGTSDSNGSTFKSTPVQATGVYTAASVVVSASFSCALIGGTGGAGTVRCWGSNGLGQLGNGRTSVQETTPTTVSGLDGVVQIAAGDGHACALRVDSTVECWGSGVGVNSTVPVDMGVSGVKEIAAGSDRTCMVFQGGTIRCWGTNLFGQIGDGTLNTPEFNKQVSGISTAVSVSVGFAHNCAVLADGTLRCWGRNANGQLGDGTTSNRNAPVTPAISNVVAVSAGRSHTCALVVDGTVHCWGDNTLDQLGITASVQHTPGLPVPGLTGAIEIATGSKASCARQVSGFVFCWGANDVGELGNGTSSSVPTNLPTLVSGISGTIGARGLVTRGSTNCARRGNGAVSCWGRGAVGELGNGATLSSSSAVNVTGLTDAVNLGGGFFHNCAARANGTAVCWGQDASGELGDGGTTAKPTPVAVTGLSTVSAVSPGGSHSCALSSNGTVSCWGSNSSGQLGVGPVSSAPIPTLVFGLTNAIGLSAGLGHTCAVRVDGSVWCWGDNSHGQLGNNMTGTNSPIPVQVLGLSNIVSVIAASTHTCVVTVAGAMYCWGDNTYGQLGNGNNLPRAVPDFVSGLKTAVAAAAGDRHTCALRVNGSASCWGSDGSLQLGSAATGNSNVPVNVISNFVTVNTSSGPVTIPIQLSSAFAIGAGDEHSCALIVASPACWGDNLWGQIGNSAVTNSAARPTQTNSFTANVDPAVGLRSNGRIAIVNAILDCPAGDQVHILMSVLQDRVEGNGVGEATCTGAFSQVPVTVPAKGSFGFQLGAATAEVEAIVREKGSIVEDQHWTRTVELLFLP